MTDNQGKSRLDRRQFLKLSSVATGALGAIGALGAQPALAAACVPPPAKWDRTVDVLIIGSGFAGLAAAIEARGAGADTLVIDKMPVYGGNSVINGGDLAAAGTPMQKEAGIEDSADVMLKDMLRAGAYLNHVPLAKTVADQSAATLAWCQSIGAKFARVNFHGGHSVKRSHQCDNESGSGLVTPMLAKCRELGVKLENRTRLVRLYTNDAGRVIGAELARGYRFPDEKTGKPEQVQVRRAVVLASGGFSQDVPLRQMHDPRLDERFTSTNHAGATGEALTEANRVGALSIQMDWIQLGPWTSPDEKGFGYIPQFVERVVGYGLMVDPVTGKRFFKETGNRKERADAIILLGHPAVIIADAPTTQRLVPPGQFKGATENGALRKFDSLEELAKAYNMPVDAFVEQVKRWNGFIEKRNDADLGGMIFKDAAPQVNPPFFAARLWPRVHHTMGGLAINTGAQVIGLDLKPIAGLYAAGEAAGGIHGAVRLGSVAMTDCVVFGRIAGRNAAKDPVAA